MVNPIAFDWYETALECDQAFYSHSLSPVYKTFQTSTLPQITPSQRLSPPRCCNPIDTVYEYPLTFQTSPIITPSPERIFHGSRQRVWSSSSTDRDHHADWYDDLDCTHMPPIVALHGPAKGLIVYRTDTLFYPSSAMDWHRTREHYWDTALGVSQDQDSDQKNSTKQDDGGGLYKDPDQKDQKQKDQSLDQDQDQETPQRENTGLGQKRGRGRPPGSMNKCEYCKIHKLLKCIRNEPYPCSNCTIGKRDKRTCDGHGVEKPFRRGRGKPRTKCDHCHGLKKNTKCDRNKPTVNAVYPCSRCVRDKKPCLPLPAGYPIFQATNFKDENADTDKGQAQAEERSRLYPSPLNKNDPYSPPAVSNETEAGTLGTVVTTSLISLPTDPTIRHWDGSKQSPTRQPLPTHLPTPIHSSSNPTKPEDERLASLSSTYRGQQCHNCIRYSDICDRYWPCSACTNNVSRGQCLSAESPSWADFGLKEGLREEDNEKARGIEEKLRRYLG
jgi:hypothetical protein